MPKELEQREPTFNHTEAAVLPSCENGDLSYKIITGKAFGKISPVAIHSALFFIEIKSNKRQSVNCGGELFGEMPFSEERTNNWNFVSSDKALTEKA